MSYGNHKAGHGNAWKWEWLLGVGGNEDVKNYFRTALNYSNAG